MTSIPELLDGHVTLEVEYLDRLYLNGYIGPLATSGGLVTFMRERKDDCSRQFLFTRDKAVYVNHYYFHIDNADFGPLFLNV